MFLILRLLSLKYCGQKEIIKIRNKKKTGIWMKIATIFIFFLSWFIGWYNILEKFDSLFSVVHSLQYILFFHPPRVGLIYNIVYCRWYKFVDSSTIKKPVKLDSRIKQVIFHIIKYWFCMSILSWYLVGIYFMSMVWSVVVWFYTTSDN